MCCNLKKVGVWWKLSAKVVRVRYEGGVLKPIKRIEDLESIYRGGL